MKNIKMFIPFEGVMKLDICAESAQDALNIFEAQKSEFQNSPLGPVDFMMHAITIMEFPETIKS